MAKGGKQAAVDSNASVVVASFVLQACQRHGGEDDWWVERHVHCTGALVLQPGMAVTCTCPCHTDPTSPEAHARAAATPLAEDRVGQAAWARQREVSDGELQ